MTNPQILRIGLLATLTILSASCVTQQRQPDGNVFITDRPPRFGYRGTDSPNYPAGQQNPDDRYVKDRSGTLTNKPKKEDMGEDPSQLHGKPDKPDSDSGPTVPDNDKPKDDTATVDNSNDKPEEKETPKANKESTTKHPYGIPLIGQKGVVLSPFAPDKGKVDVSGMKSGAKVYCPFTDKIFLVP